MEIYNDYLKQIKNAMVPRQGIGSVYNFEGDTGTQKEKTFSQFLNESKDPNPLPSLQTLAEVLKVQPNYNSRLGSHPDFSHLKNSGTAENHSIVSVFIDIKGSTNLFKRYPPQKVFVISNIIQKAAIHTSLILGGYIQRLHGDGLFVYFGGKGKDDKVSIERALQAASLFSHFVKNELTTLFEDLNVEPIFTRIGLDFGETDDVVWAMAGHGEISEITTCSLHTSLASKMQAMAASNGIVIGNNIKSKLSEKYQSFISSVVERTREEKHRYIFRNPDTNFNYSQFDFNWISFLKALDFLATDLSGNITLKRQTIPQPAQIDRLASIAVKSVPYFKGDGFK